MEWNIILVGDSGVGKTSMIQRFVQNKFIAKYSVTVGADLFSKVVDVEGKSVKLVIWDSAGQEIYKSIVPMFFRKADGCILVYDVTDITTFHRLSGWLSEFRTFNEKAPVIIAGNKTEDPNKESVGLSVVKSFAREDDIEYVECSAMSGEGVQAAFDLLLNKMWKNLFDPKSVTKVDEDETQTARKNVAVNKLDSVLERSNSIMKAEIPDQMPEFKSIPLEKIKLRADNPHQTRVKKKSFCC